MWCFCLFFGLWICVIMNLWSLGGPDGTSLLLLFWQVEDLLKNYENVCTLRVRMPISSDLSNPRNFITKITRYEKVVNIPNSMTILDELLTISIEMAKRNLTGIWNFTNPGVVSHNEILEMYREYIDPNFTWKNFSLEEQAKVIVAPRSNNELDASKLKQEFPELLGIKESLIQNVFKPNRKAPVAWKLKVWIYNFECCSCGLFQYLRHVNLFPCYTQFFPVMYWWCILSVVLVNKWADMLHWFIHEIDLIHSFTLWFIWVNHLLV